MYLKWAGILLMISVLSILPFITVAQDVGGDPDKVGAPNIIHTGKSGNVHKLTSQEKKIAKTKKKQAKEAAKALKAATKFHEKIQSKQTKQMMKESKAKSEAWHDNKKVPWWKKIFTKKHKGE